MSVIAEKLENVKRAQKAALQFAPLTVKATAEFVLKPVNELLEELVAEIDQLKKGKS